MKAVNYLQHNYNDLLLVNLILSYYWSVHGFTCQNVELNETLESSYSIKKCWWEFKISNFLFLPGNDTLLSPFTSASLIISNASSFFHIHLVKKEIVK